MREKDAKAYIEKLGLEQAHNAIKRISNHGAMEITNINDLMNTAVDLIAGCVQKYGQDYRATVYILRQDGTAHFVYNDSNGFNGTDKQPIEKVKYFAKEFSKDEDYILLVEVEKDKYVIVTQM
jgi:hypothetical protein